MTYAYRLLSGGYVDEYGTHRGVPPTEDDYRRISIHMAHRMLFGPYDLEIKQEMPIEEANKRWPDMFDKEEDVK
jgi:hypothetical protein